MRHGIVPANFTVERRLDARPPPPSPAESWSRCSPSSAPGGAPRACGRRSRSADAAVEPRLLGPGRLIGGLLALAGAVPLFAVSTTTRVPETAAATSEMTAIMLVVAVGFLGPIVARVGAKLLGPPLAALAPVGGFLASANLGAATRRFSSASTPLVLIGRHELHPAVQQHDHRPCGLPGAARGPVG